MSESSFDVLVEAFRDAKAQLTDSARAVRADIVAPADPSVVRLTRAERLADFNDFMSNPARRESEFARLKDRYAVPDGAVPRRLVDYVISNLRDQKRVDKGQ